MIAQFMETYSHRPVETVQYFTHGRNSWIFDITSKYFSFFNNTPSTNWVVDITRNFLTYYSCLYYSSMVAVNYDPGTSSNISWKLDKSQLPIGSLEFVNHHIVPNCRISLSFFFFFLFSILCLTSIYNIYNIRNLAIVI